MLKIFHLVKRINTLENENTTLKNIIKSELYKDFMAQLAVPDDIVRLKKENKKLREDRKNLRRMLEEKSLDNSR